MTINLITCFTNMKILVIEDDKRVAGLIERGLSEQGFNVTLAYDGLSGKKLALENSYDLVITDIIMPGPDGIDLCREIRQKDPDIPIIMLTALGTTDDKVEGFDAGADDYLVKPFEMRELLARINALLKRNRRDRTAGNILSYADLEMNLDTRSVKRGDDEINLTPKEFKLLEYMMRNPEREKTVMMRLRTKITLLFTAITTAIVLVFAAVIYFAAERDREREYYCIITPGT